MAYRKRPVGASTVLTFGPRFRRHNVMEKDLIYDVGVHNGDDTAYYLKSGYRVIGVEANPIMIADLERRFPDAIKIGRLILLNVGIAEMEGQQDFWICDGISEWSSFNRDFAARHNQPHRAIKVKTCTLASILARYGTPLYCKIDIEGSDRLCVKAIARSDDPPKFVSWEMGYHDDDSLMDDLQQRGFRHFKIISQVTWSQPILASAELAFPPKIRRYFHRLDKKLRGNPRDRDWHFPFGSSGAFGDKTAGRWRSQREIIKQWHVICAADAKYGVKGTGGNWFDIHAARD